MKSKKGLLLIIIFLAIILIAFAGVYAYITLDIFKTPKQLFVKYLDNEIMQVKDLNVGVLKTIFDNIKNNTSETELDLKVEEYENVSEVKVGLKRDPANSLKMWNLNINNNDNELANYSLLLNNERIALKVPELNDKYFSIELSSLMDLLNKNNILEKDIELSTESIEKYKNEINNLYSKYWNEIKTYLTEDKFTSEKNVQVDVNGQNTTANKYIFSIKTSECINIISDLLNKITEEEILSEFMTEEQISELKDNINDSIQDMQEDNNEDKVLNVCIYESSGNTVKIELQVDQEVAEFIILKTSDSESNIIMNIIAKKSETNDVESKETIEYVINVQDENTTIVTSKTSTTYNKDDIEELKKSNEYSEEMIDERYKNISSTMKMTTTLNGDKATTKISSDALEDLGIEIEKFQYNFSFGSQVTFDDVNDTINLEDYIDDEEKQMELMQECMQNLQNNPNSLISMLFDNNLNIESDEVEQIPTENLDGKENEDEIKEDIENIVVESLNHCLNSYKRDLELFEDTNISDYLTVNKIYEMMLSSRVSNLELIDGSTLKLKYDDETYYISLVLSSENLKVEEATVYTESEYQELQ